jgi:hypothetical protein
VPRYFFRSHFKPLFYVGHQVEVVAFRFLWRWLIHHVEFTTAPVNNADIGSSAPVTMRAT